MRRIILALAIGLMPITAHAQVKNFGLGSPNNPDWGMMGNGQFVLDDAMHFTGTVPTVANGATDCGTSPVIAGNNNIMRITVGSGTNGGKCTVTFAANNPWTNSPICHANDETTVANVVQTTPTTTAVVVKAVSTITAGDAISVSCGGYK